ncbi:long-chain fatty acid--CoA ligase [Coprococcus eutactus]|jgi:long-chain acyl-CoA synthetase|uniref:Long-chain fatty acid--CoA ligase n=1 Tax=Coprococcus eutactus TaxID=33043 RepID=A0A3R5WPR0_9FIRM|nr:long-chain fatty acid--CoA ligase [Coprococcus eutactus]
MDTILHYIQKYAQTQPDTMAVCELRKSVTYKEYWSSIRKTAGVLMGMGIRKGDHVMLRCTQNIDYLIVFSALQYMQALVIPVEKSTSAERVLEIGERVDSECLISDKEADGISSIKIKDIIARAKDADEADLELPGENDRSMLLFTTGTTGSSKGVVMLHRGEVGIAGNVIEGTSMKKGNVEIIPMPLNHSFGIRRYQSDMVNGGTVCLMDGMVFIGTLWKLVEKYGATSMAISPASLGMIFHLSDERIADYADQLDYIQIGSAPLAEADKEKLLRLLPDTRLYNFYGSSEAGCACILEFSGNGNKTGCIGRPTVNSIVRFTDDAGNVVENGSPEAPALLSWGGSIVMEGYYNDPDLTAETLVGGYVRTKDLAYLDEDGDCILVGRADDVINYGGSKISPAEIENLALGYEYIDDVAFTSISDPITGELPVILVIQKDGYDEAEFERFLTDRLESYKLPRKYIYVDNIPKTFKGSVLRKEVRKLAEQNV